MMTDYGLIPMDTNGEIPPAIKCGPELYRGFFVVISLN